MRRLKPVHDGGRGHDCPISFDLILLAEAGKHPETVKAPLKPDKRHRLLRYLLGHLLRYFVERCLPRLV
jgi:hypothetical protein